MRTTLTLEDDVAERVAAEARRSGRSFEETGNDLLLRGLASARAPRKDSPFKVEARNLGLRKGVSLDRVSELLDDLDGPTRR